MLVQAGSSGPGMDLGSSVADGIYTAQPFKEPSIEFYTKFKNMVAEKGRNPDDVKIIPGILPILGDTEKEAQDLANELASYVHLGNGRKQVGADLKMDLSELEFDETIPVEWFSDDPRMGSRYQIYRKKSVDMGMTLRELIVDLARSTGHQWMAGTPRRLPTDGGLVRVRGLRRLQPQRPLQPRAASSSSATSWCRNSRTAATSGRSTRAARCATTSVSRAQQPSACQPRGPA